MKKTISMLGIFLVVMFCISTIGYAAALDTVTATLSSNKIEPGQEVTITIAFGKQLGSYTFNVAYDSNIFEYVRSEGGTADDNHTRVKLAYYDQTGGSNPRENATITFKAKEGLTTSNPTDFSITAEGLANPDASEEYDDITLPIKKDILVEPNYVDYTLSLNYTGEVIEKVAKDMKLVTESSMGKNYDHVRLLAEVVSKPKEDSVVKLLATDSKRAEHDLIQNGWGEADGYAIGGKDVKQELAISGTFSDLGKYVIKISLIDRDNSDAVIVSKDFEINAKQTEEITVPEENPPKEEEIPEETEPEKLPAELPKTGEMKYVPIISFLVITAGTYAVINRKKK